MSDQFPFNLNYPLQYDKNESCVGGEIYITDNNVPPMVLSIIDMMNNSAMTDGGECTQKYFDDFNPDNYSIPVSSTLYKPAFIQQESVSSGGSYDAVIGTSGLVVGSYSYSYRLVTGDGDRTPFSPITELIPVLRRNTSSFDPYYPYSHSHGDFANIASSTNYGNHIRIKYENYSDFAFLELRRDSWYSDSAYGVPPVSEIIGSINIGAGLGILNIFDKAEANFIDAEVLDLQEQTDTYSSIRRAKSIRYFNERLYLMNIGYNSKDIDGEVTFVDAAGDPGFPTIEKIGKAGHKHPYNAAMYKSNMRGDKTGFGVVLFDSYNNPSYATEVPTLTNYPFPNRRNEVAFGGDTYGTSYKGLVLAANTEGAVTLTHEVFDHYDAAQKISGSTNLVEVEYEQGKTYKTLTPVSQADSQSTLGIPSNDKVSLDSSVATLAYRPKAFGLDYYSQGMAIKGLATYPTWAEGFSVVQTDPALQVVAQGLGFYKVNEYVGGTNTSKDLDKFWAYFPDLEHRFPDVAEDLINNPTSYSIQLVSPLGYFTEVYASKKDTLDFQRRGTDMITYARVLRDGPSSYINPYYEQSGYSGIPAGDGNSYVAYGRFMNRTTGNSPAFSANDNGDRIFPLDVSTTEVTTQGGGRQSYFQISVDTSAPGYDAIYNSDIPVGLFANSDELAQYEWREPMYVINLYKDRDVNSGITTEYKYTGHYVRFKSLVLESNGSGSQFTTLVSERWEDCIPSITGEVYNNYSGLKRFVHVEDANNISKAWMNVSFETNPDIATILTGLAAAAPGPYNDPVLTGGDDIYGIYTSTETAIDLCPQFTLNFINNPSYTAFTVPASGTKVYVKYDNRIPVRVFGGDTFINESIWAVLDNEYNKNANPVDSANSFQWSNPFPFKQYTFNNNFPSGFAGYRWWENTASFNYGYDEHQFSNSTGGDVCKMRQLVTVWTAETRCNLSFFFNLESPDKAVSEQAFPLVNYIPRPYKWNAGPDATDRTAWEAGNNLLPNYYDDYGYEWNWWGWGGFRFLPQVNKDYSKSQTTTTYTSVPTVGFEEQTDFCTRIAWSLKRPINFQNTPSIRTFPPSNIFDISDDTGEIKFAWSALSGDKGNNLYAFTDSGVCLLMVDKRVVYEINATELATVGSSIGGILNQLWIDKRIGMSDQTWRSWAEYSNVLFFVNNKSAYMFTNNELTDISRTGFHELFRRTFLDKLGRGYSSDLVGGYDVLHNEYIMSVGDSESFQTLIYGVEQQALQCHSTYLYDKYLYNNNLLYGMKDAETFQLGISAM
jgi:hypothetical protein